MLRHSSKLLVRRVGKINVVRLSSQVNSSAQNETNSQNKKLHSPIGNVRNTFNEISSSALSKYNEIVGFTEIDEAYKKVTIMQEDLHKIQNERTLVQLQISNTRSELTNLQTEIHEHRRGEAKYLELMKREFEVIQRKNKLEEHYAILDKKERELFTHLQAKINMLHEKSRTHTRQWGIISTIIGALLGIIGTSISAYYRNNDIRRIQMNFQQQFEQQIQQITKDTKHITQGYNNLMEYLQRYELTLKSKESEIKNIQQNKESWEGYLKRKSISFVKWFTLEKSS